MNSETRNCQNCKNDFTIEPDDFSFYEKIKVPPPTFCPECRMIRRMVWRNHRSLYKRVCGLCSKSLISMYQSEDTPVYCIECFNGDNWDQYIFAEDIDFSRNFIQQIFDIFSKQPRIYQYRIGTVVNSDYGNSIVNCKNAYLSFSVVDCEEVMYCESVDRTKNTIDSFASYDLDNCYQNILSDRNYNSHFMISSHSCIDSLFLFDCTNCQSCALSSNLRNKKYVFKNKQLSKDEYEDEISKLNTHTFSGLEKSKIEFSFIYQNAIHKYADILNSQNSNGNFILNSKDVHNSFDATNGCENIRNSFRMIKSKDAMDCQYVLTGEMIYECSSSSQNSYQHIASLFCFSSKNIEYSMFCKNCSDCFGCVGLKNAKYCILNKQYTEQEYFKNISALRKSMNDNPYIDQQGRVYSYGDFFPFEKSPFSYNETVALDYFPLSKNEIKNKGYSLKDKDVNNYSITLNNEDLPDDISTTDDSILDEIISCTNTGKETTQCTTAFRIVRDELQFYRQKKLPLPRLCPNCRHYDRLKYRNPMKLYERVCSNGCGNSFQTTYAPDRPEKVYCESCYQKEVL